MAIVLGWAHSLPVGYQFRAQRVIFCFSNACLSTRRASCRTLQGVLPLVGVESLRDWLIHSVNGLLLKFMDISMCKSVYLWNTCGYNLQSHLERNSFNVFLVFMLLRRQFYFYLYYRQMHYLLCKCNRRIASNNNCKVQ